MEELLSRLPREAQKELQKVYNSLSSSDREDFDSQLGRCSTIDELKELYPSHILTPLSEKIFLISSKGIGAGEIWTAWLLKDAKLSGMSEHYDITQGNNKFEIKAYNYSKHWKTREFKLTKYEGPWRLGNAGAMSNFKFIENLLYNAEIAHKIKDSNVEIPAIKDLIAIVNKLEEMSPIYGMIGDFARGEVGKKKLALMFEFIDSAHHYINQTRTEYDIVTFGSTTPGNPDTTFIIEEKEQSSLENGKFKVVRAVDLHNYNDPVVLNRALVRSRYIREGIHELINDINSDLEVIEQKYNGVKFVVFRKDKVNISNKLHKINGTTKKDLVDALSTIFSISAASVRVKEEQ